MRSGVRRAIILWAAIGTLGCTCSFADQPDDYRILTGDRFMPLEPGDAERPPWLFAVSRAYARSADGSQEWAIYDLALDRRLAFHHLLLETALQRPVSDLYVRLLDAQRRVVSADLMGNIATRAPESGNVTISIPLSTAPDAAIVQLLIPREDEPALRMISAIPASYEIILQAAGDFASGARSWVRTPVYDPKNVSILTDLIISPDSQSGDVLKPLTAFAGYGVDVRPASLSVSTADSANESPYATATFALDAIPALARFDVLLRHVDVRHPPEVWLNGRRIGALSIDWPDLEDPAYWPDEHGGLTRVSRRIRAWRMIDHEWLKLGDNEIVVRNSAGAPNDPPLEIERARVQFKYPWESLATFSIIGDGSHFRIPDGVMPAPQRTHMQDDDRFIVNLASSFQAIGVNHPKPPWLHSIDRESFERMDRYVIRFTPDRVPDAVGLDLIYMRGGDAEVRLELLREGRVVAENPFGRIRLDSTFVQSSLPLHVPLRDYNADAIAIEIPRLTKYGPYMSRFQLKALWTGAALAKGHLETDGSLATLGLEPTSAFIPAEMRLPDEAHGDSWIRRVPSQWTGEWYGVETRLLNFEELKLGDDNIKVDFREFELTINEQPLLVRLDLLAFHINVIEDLQLLVNGQPVASFSLDLPDLQDANYMLFRVNRLNSAGDAFAGGDRYAIDYGSYTRAAVVFDGSWLKPGLNTISIGKPFRLQNTNDDYKIKDVRLQLKRPWVADISTQN